jgi:hypothetical protein
MAARRVGAAAEERDGPAARQAQDCRPRGAGLGPGEAGEVAAPVGRPAEPPGAVGAQERERRAELAEPQVDPLAADAARPQAHDEHPDAVPWRRGGADVAGRDPPARAHVRVVAVRPASITSTWPVTQRASSLAR